MTDESTDKQYDLEPHEPEPPEPEAIRALDVCPNCGSPMGGVDVVVCMRCGFDLKKLKVIKTETGATEAPDEGEAETPVLVRPGAGDLWLPAALAIIGVGVLLFGHLAGWPGLFAGAEEVGLGARLAGLLKMLIRTAVIAVSALGALYFLAHVLKSQLGDLKLAAVRSAGIAGAIGLLALFNVDSIALEWTLEFVAEAIAFVGLAMVFFNLGARDATTLLGVTVMAVVSVLLVSALVVWVWTP